MRIQRRWRCRECQREWCYRTDGLESNCFACGSPELERVQFDGLFDSTTPREISEQAERLPWEAAKVLERGSKSSTVPPPVTLKHG